MMMWGITFRRNSSITAIFRSQINDSVLALGVLAGEVSSAMTYLRHHTRVSYLKGFWRTTTIYFTPVAAVFAYLFDSVGKDDHTREVFFPCALVRGLYVLTKISPRNLEILYL